jgi:peptidoglycan hydrolase-like protein with peptidoglycan-binding domain
VPAAVAGAAVVGVAATVAVRGGGAAQAAPPAPPPVSTATVARASLATTTLTAGMLGYAPLRPIVNQLPGTYTWLPAFGTRIRAGHALFRVDNLPVVLMHGRTPAWRPFAPGMTSGPDVRELQANLIALGYADGLLTAPTGQFDLATTDAVERWQAAAGYPVTGQIPLGQVVFLPTHVLVGAANAAPGQAATPGEAPYQATSTERVVSVPLNPDLPSVHPGERVTIVLPSNARVRGRVANIGAGPVTTGSSGSQSGQGGPPQSGPVATVVPARPRATGTGTQEPVQVSLTVESVGGVLAVPVSALLALAGGGYGVEVAGPGGHHLVGVSTGVFAGSRVQIHGPGIAAGTKVVVAP